MPPISPWAQVQQDAQPDPSMVAPIALPDQSAPSMPAPKQPQVWLSPQQQTPLQENIAHDQQALKKIQWQKDNPMGSANNHPGFLGKLGHAFGTLGNIAGDIFAPATMAMIPGTQLHREAEEGRLTKQLNAEQQEQSQNEERGATTAEAKERTAEMPAKAASEEKLQGAQAGNLESETQQRNQPDLAKAYAHRVNEVLAQGGDPSQDPVVQHLSDAITSIQPQRVSQKGLEHVSVVGPNGKPEMANFHPDTGQYTDATGKVIPNPQPYEKQPQAPGITMIVPDPNHPGGGVVQRLTSGQTVAPGAQTAAGVNAVNTPTMTQRTAAGRAATVVAMAPEVLAEIDRLAPQLGPVSGRWNEFMQGRVGADNPDFAGLRTDLIMMSSAVALAHAQGRLPENLRQEFDHMINAPQQTPENIKATINHVLPWLQKMQEGGQGPMQRNGPQPQAGPPPGADVKVKGKDGKLYWGNSKTKEVYGEAQ
jgi:hypothetical protein